MGYIIGHDLFKMPVEMKNVVMLSKINEYKGQQIIYKKRSKEILSNLNERALLEFTYDSCSDLTIKKNEIKKIFLNEESPSTRDEISVLEFKDILKTVNNAYNDIKIDEKVIRELHGYLYRYSSVQGGKYKERESYSSNNVLKENSISSDLSNQNSDKDVEEKDFDTIMKNLCQKYNLLIEEENVDKLIVIAVFIIDFILISPFVEGNIKMAKLLTLLLLNQNGYEVSRYTSLGNIYDEHTQLYYKDLFTDFSERDEFYHNVNKWLNYFFGFILESYKHVAVDLKLNEAEKETKTKRIEKIVNSTLGYFTKDDIREQCPDIPEPTINRVFNNMRKSGKIEVVAKGRSAKWKKL